MLSAIGWDLRALGEAQLRSLTSMQRCIEEFQATGDPHAADEIRRHAKALEERSVTVRDSLQYLIETLDRTAPATAS
jgi:hypothetical protein